MTAKDLAIAYSYVQAVEVEVVCAAEAFQCRVSIAVNSGSIAGEPK